MTKQFVNEIKKGDSVDSMFVIIEKQTVKEYKYGFMFSLKISDKTSSIFANYFGGTDKQIVEQLWSTLKEGKIFHIIAEAGEFNSAVNLAISPTKGGIIEEVDSFNPEDFIAKTEKNIETMKSELKQIIENVSDPELNRLLKSFFDDIQFMKKFSESPAAMSRHHNYVGGLLEHVLSLIDISKIVVKIHPKLNLDYLIAGCIFHDIGKIEEYQVGMGITYTTNGKLAGHIPIGYKMVSEKINTLGTFSEITSQKILHMILSHHGQLNWGSPVIPAFPEAIALHFIDQVDAKIKGIFQDIGEVNSDIEWSAKTKDYGSLFLK